MSETVIDKSKNIAYLADVGDFFALLKPRVMSLVVFTGFAGLYIAPISIHPLIGAVAVLCIAVGSGAAGAINMWYDRDIDAIMSRTKNRPIPAGLVNPDEALSFGIVLSFAAVFLMGVAVNWVAASLLLGAILFYVFIYTMGLKRRTPYNIVIGGAAGAFPPMIGWAAATGGVSIESVMLFGLIFFWTPPHFWALALFRCDDYKKANIPMLPVVNGIIETKKQIILYTLILLPISVAPYFMGIAGIVYGITACLLSMLFIAASITVWFDKGDKQAKRMFAYSILYLFTIFGVMIADNT